MKVMELNLRLRRENPLFIALLFVDLLLIHFLPILILMAKELPLISLATLLVPLL